MNYKYVFFRGKKLKEIDQLFSIPILNIIYILRSSIEDFEKNIEIELFLKNIPIAKNFEMVENNYCMYYLRKYVTKEFKYLDNKLTFNDIIFNCVTKSYGTNINHNVILNRKQFNIIRYIASINMVYSIY